MKNQFLYTRTIKEGETEKKFTDSFNMNKVIRAVTDSDGTVIIILDDFNERVVQKHDIDPKTNKYKGVKNVRETVQSEIVLSIEDGARFFKLTNIE